MHHSDPTTTQRADPAADAHADTIAHENPGGDSRRASRPSRWRPAAPIAIVLLVLAVFMPALTAGYVNWDDDDLLIHNTHYQSLSPSNLRWMFTTSYAGHFQPLTWATYALDYVLWGDDPLGYHLTNVLLHAATAVAFYFVARRLLAVGVRENPSAPSWLLVWSGAFAACLFAVHPLRAESVVWIAERRDVLSGFLYVLSVGAYLRFAALEAPSAEDSRGPKPPPLTRRSVLPHAVVEATVPQSGTRRVKGKARSALFYAAAVGLCFLSLLAKASAVTLPLVLLILDVYPLRRLGDARNLRRRMRRIAVEKLPFVLLALAGGARALIAQQQGGALSTYIQHDAWARLAQTLYGLTFYVWKTVWPVGLGPLYQVPARAVLLGSMFWISLGAVVAMAVTVVALRRRLPAAATALAVYVVVLSPVLGVAQSGPQLVADRYSYLSCLGLAVLAGGALWQALTRLSACGHAQAGRTGRADPRRRALIVLGAAGLVTLLAHATYRQSDIWQSPMTLWEHGVRVSPDSSIAHANFADALSTAGALEQALPHFQRALALDPRDAIAAAHVGRVFSMLRAPLRAAEMYERALQIDPDRSDTRVELARLLIDAGRVERALTVLRSRAREAPHDLRVIDYLAQLLATHPDAAVRNGPEAVRWASIVSRAHGDSDALSLMTLATALAEALRFDDAVAAATRAQTRATKAGDAHLAAELTRRLDLFRAEKPYHFGE